MSHLVVGNRLLFSLAHRTVLSLGTADSHKLEGLEEISLAYELPVILDGDDRAFIDDIRKVGPYKPRTCHCDRGKIHGLVHHDIL